MLSREKRIDLAVLAVATLGSGALSLSLGQDFNFDQIHYHFYQGWSLIAGRLDQDIAAAGIGTYLNPVLHVPTYLGIAYLPPRVIGFLLGAAHGLNAFLAYRLALRVLEGQPWKLGLAVLVGLAAALGPGALGLLGTTFGDNLASLPALAALLLLVGAPLDGRGQVSGARAVLVGALAGAATGLKLTLGVFHLALAAAVAVLALRTRSTRLALGFALGSALGGLATGGYWAFQMWVRFGNPVFPLANAVFQSPDYAATNFRDELFQSRGPQDLWIAPADMAVGDTLRLQQVRFRDPCYLVLLGAAVGAVLGRLFGDHSARGRGSLAGTLVIVYWFTAYAVWLWLFFYYRYFVAGEFLAPVAIVALLALALPRRPGLAAAFLVATIGLCSGSPNWGRLPWSKSWYRVRLPEMAQIRGAAVIVDGGCLSYVLPAFPSGTRFFHPRQLPGLRPRIARALLAHTGPILRLTRGDQPPSRLEEFGLSDSGDCEAVYTREFRLDLCRLDRVRRSR